MSSLDDILNRVLNQAVDSAATKIQGAVIGRRPLRDPDSGAGAVGYSNPAVFSDLQSAIRTIHDPAIAQGLKNSAARSDAAGDSGGLGSDDFDGIGQDSSTSPAVRKTTVADDLSVIGTITQAGSSIAKDMAVAGKATQGLADSAGKLDRAVIELTRSVVKATPRTSENQSPGIVGGVMNRASGFLESNSIAESIRAMMSKLRNGSDISAGVGDGTGGGDGGAIGESSFADRLSAGFDRALARSMMFFRSMSAGSGGGSRGNGSGGNGGDGDGGGDGLDSSPLSGRSLRTIVSQRIGRAGRRALVGAFRGRVMRGMRGLRGRGATGGGGGTGGGWAGRIGGMPPGGMIGGGIHHGAAGGGGGAAGGAAAGAGGISGGVIAIIGVVAAFAALIAIINTASQAIYKLGMQGYETALRVSQYNGELNIAKAQLNVGRLMRDIQTAQDLSKSGAGMMRAIDKLEEVLRPITTEVLSMSMDLLTKAIETLTETIRSLTSLGRDTMKFMDAILAGMQGLPVNPAFQGNQGQNQNNQAQPDFLGLHNEFANRAIPLPPRGPIPPMGGAKP